MTRGKRIVTLDLRSDEAVEGLLALVEAADVLIEGFRPGVAERLGLGPAECRARNERLIYARLTGWGQSGPLALSPGHDINYLALTGVLHAIGRAGQVPVPPLNLLGDFGGGSMLALVGILAGLQERQVTGRGQVIDAAIVDGVTLLAQMIWALRGAGVWSDERESNLLDGGAPFYDTYACSDGGFVAVGAVEPQFFAGLIAGLGLSADEIGSQHDRDRWPEMAATIAARFATRTRAQWEAEFDGRVACVTPVLSFAEAAAHPQLTSRNTLIGSDSRRQAAPAPRFGGSTSQSVAGPARAVAADLSEIASTWISPPLRKAP